MKTTETPLKRFLFYTLLVAVAGLVIAVFFDSPVFGEDTDYVDAFREVGGAIVSGALVAGLVLWFEEKRETERVQREEKRDDQAAEKAWKREIDIRLVTVVSTELAHRRTTNRRELEKQTIPSDLVTLSSPPSKHRSIKEVRIEIDGLLEFLRDDALTEEWNNWSKANTALNQPMKSAKKQMNALGHPIRDSELHAEAAHEEQTAWNSFKTCLNNRIEAEYPNTTD